jgi:hypothetical protein
VKNASKPTIHQNAISIQLIPWHGQNLYRDFCAQVRTTSTVYKWLTDGKRIWHSQTKRYTGHIDISEGAGGILIASVSSDVPDIAAGDFVSRAVACLHDRLLAVNLQPHW